MTCHTSRQTYFNHKDCKVRYKRGLLRHRDRMCDADMQEVDYYVEDYYVITKVIIL